MLVIYLLEIKALPEMQRLRQPSLLLQKIQVLLLDIFYLLIMLVATKH